jgi:hypothetical protein
MCGGMMTLQLIPPVLIHSACDSLPDQILIHFNIQEMQDTFAHFFHIYNPLFLVVEHQIACVMGLASGSRVEWRFVKNYYVGFLRFAVFEHSDHFALEPQFMRVVVGAFGFFQMGRVVELDFGGFGHLFLAVRDFVVEIAGNLLVSELLYDVRGNPPRGHCDYPVVD